MTKSERLREVSRLARIEAERFARFAEEVERARRLYQLIASAPTLPSTSVIGQTAAVTDALDRQLASTRRTNQRIEYSIRGFIEETL
jgi:hypothetical protein